MGKYIVITYTAECEMILLIHSQTSTVQLFKFCSGITKLIIYIYNIKHRILDTPWDLLVISWIAICFHSEGNHYL